jgi:hypothetical protein
VIDLADLGDDLAALAGDERHVLLGGGVGGAGNELDEGLATAHPGSGSLDNLHEQVGALRALVELDLSH